ncbi:2'-5' RNA ligase family protein [Cryobacterium sp. SO2]|uniref:2'-5' RNA ligase family protein n=1 Tax=Cryobacterium sp. SO2 TaxID=1897060 RepID=UPI00223DC30A|nr:2'-5' RNA ligase family protein [Cryobacterium sp. SO2]WEO77255.1 2'-5' RNA ligase family protein [Cryobacterium sp. SO2]
MPRLVIVLPVAALRVGDSFAVSAWPLHVTVLPPFLTDSPAADIAAAMADVARTRPPLTVAAGEDALFGRRHDVPVSLIVPSEELTTLHQALLAAIRPFAAEPDEPAFTGPGFRPHVTQKPPARLNPGAVLTLTQLALVDMLPRAHLAGRTVQAVSPLREP